MSTRTPGEIIDSEANAAWNEILTCSKTTQAWEVFAAALHSADRHGEQRGKLAGRIEGLEETIEFIRSFARTYSIYQPITQLLARLAELRKEQGE